MRKVLAVAVITLAAAVVIALAAVAAFAQAPRVKAIYKTMRISPMEVGISCQNGADPTVAGNIRGILVVSCGK